MSSINIIMDNGGGVTTQFVDENGQEFACWRQDMRSAADDILAFLAGPSVANWEGHDEDANALHPSHEEVANGGYRLWYACDEDGDADALLHEMREAVAQMEQSDWANCIALAEALREDAVFASVAD